MSILATPIEAGLGGVALGVLSLGRFLIHGKIFGISGNLKGFLKNPRDTSRAAVIAGLAAGGAGLKLFAPSCFGIIPATLSVKRAAVAGILVGAGSSLANGCTSGHGICGNARFSQRSMFFTVVIMATGALTARLAGTADALAVSPSGFPPLAIPSQATVLLGLGLISATAAALCGFATALKRSGLEEKEAAAPNREGKAAVELAADAVEGLLFSLSLGFAGMTDPRKVAGFLNVGSRGFDYSLAFVMCGAILTAVVPFASAARGKGRTAVTGRPLRSVGDSGIDTRLVLGAILFGVGWGAAGLCPGPAVVGLATLKKQVVAFTAAASAALYVIP